MVRGGESFAPDPAIPRPQRVPRGALFFSACRRSAAGDGAASMGNICQRVAMDGPATGDCN